MALHKPVPVRPIATRSHSINKRMAGHPRDGAHDLHFTNKETEAQRLSDLAQVAWLGGQCRT